MKIPTEDFTDETLAIDDTQGDDVRGGDWVLVMEVDKVANEVNVMEVDKVTNMMAKITNEDSSDETLAIDDTQGDDVRGGDWGAGHGG